MQITVPARSRAQLTATGLHLNRGGRPVLSDLHLAAGPGSRWGVVGENGRGKSTLLAALTGRLAPDSGDVRREGTLGVADQEMPVDQGRTVGDAIDLELADSRRALAELDRAAEALADDTGGAADDYATALAAAEAFDAWDADRRVDIALAGLHATTDRARPLGTLSVGQRYRVRLACLLGAGHDFLILDEPTNHLDAGGLDHLTRHLRAHPGGVVLVSHDRALLADVVTDVIDLDPTRDGRPRTYGDGFAGYLEGRRRERAQWVEDYQRQQSEHQQLTRDLADAQSRLVTGWRPDKGTGKHQRATRAPGVVRSVNRRRDALEEHALTVPPPPLALRFPELPGKRGATLLRAVDATVEGRMARPVSLTLEPEQHLLVTGPNGTGKSTLLDLLAGRQAPSEGDVRRPREVRIALVAQESEAPSVKTPARLLEEAHGPSPSALGLLDRRDAQRPMRELSVGQQRRVDLALALAGRPHVLLLDEPTNHLSIALVDELTAALRTTRAAVVVATHDRQLLRDLADWPRVEM